MLRHVDRRCEDGMSCASFIGADVAYLKMIAALPSIDALARLSEVLAHGHASDADLRREGSRVSWCRRQGRTSRCRGVSVSIWLMS
jgi:hypothetical protein